MSCYISVCAVILIIFIAGDVYLLNNRWDKSWLTLPCRDYLCDFSSLDPIFGQKKVLKIESYWDIKLENSNLNVSQLYYCGDYSPVIKFSRCDMKGYYITLVAVNVIIFLLTIKIMLITRNERLRALNNQNPPDYTLLPPWA